MAILSFSDRDVERWFVFGKVGKNVKWKGVARIAKRKLDMLHYATVLGDLKSPPNNRLEALKGDLKGY